MKKTITVLIFITCGVIAYSFTAIGYSAEIKSTKSILSDSLKADREKYIAIVLGQIKGKENLPVDSVYKNLKIFKQIKAKDLLFYMDIAYSQSLGVSCGHCHNTNDFASEEKVQKQITREMSAMSNTINNNLLKNIKNLQSSPAVINCTTCHRGQTKPALDIE